MEGLAGIRDATPQDTPALAALFHAAVRQTGLRDYTAAQVAAWSPAPPAPALYLDRLRQKRLFLVAVDRFDTPLGYADLEANGHIDHLYCRPDVVGTGIGAALYDRLEKEARQRGMPALFVEASEAARRLLLHRGFTIEARQVFERHGVMLHNYRMRKVL